MNITNKNLVNEHNQITKDIKEKIKNNNYTIENPLIILNPYKTSPLSALIAFDTVEKGYCKVKITGKDEDTTIENTFDSITNKHIIPIYGLYPNHENIVVVEVIFDDSKNTSKHKFNIKTNALPEDMLDIEVKTKSNTKELTFVTESYCRAFDKNGEVRWYLSKGVVMDKVSPICFLKNGNILTMNNKLLHHNYYVSGICEINLLGKIENEFTINGAHHEILELNNGDLMVACEKGDVTTEDYIVILDRNTGEIKADFDFREILNIIPEGDLTYQNCLYNYRRILNKEIHEKQLQAEVKLKFMFDWLHMNSVFYNEDENYVIVSSRVKDSVIKINSITKEIIWIFTDDNIDWCDEHKSKILKPTNFDRPNYCYGQHSAKMTPQGQLIIFDNGNFRSKDFTKATPPNENYSRGVGYTIDEENLTITQVFEFGKDLKEKIYSCYLGNIEYITNDHYLINFGGIIYDDEGNLYDAPVVVIHESISTKTVITEVKDNKVIGEYVIDKTNTYRAYRHNIYMTTQEHTLNDDGKMLGNARPTNTADIIFSIDDVEEFEKLEYKINEISDIGDRLIFDIDFINCDPDSDKYVIFTDSDKNTLIFGLKNNFVGVNKCTLEALKEDYKVALFCNDLDEYFAWI